MILNVPAQVCGTCGGEVFADPTVEVFERIRDGHVQPHGVVRLDAFDFALIQQPATPSPTLSGFNAPYSIANPPVASEFVERVENEAVYAR